MSVTPTRPSSICHALPRSSLVRLCAVGKTKVAGPVLVERTLRDGGTGAVRGGGGCIGVIPNADDACRCMRRCGRKDEEGEEGSEEGETFVEDEHCVRDSGSVVVRFVKRN